MGTIIKNLGGRRPAIYIERRIDDIEIQKLTFHLTNDSWLSTETGDSIRLFGRDENGNTVEVEIPISISELKESLGILEWRYLNDKMKQSKTVYYMKKTPFLHLYINDIYKFKKYNIEKVLIE